MEYLGHTFLFLFPVYFQFHAFKLGTTPILNIAFTSSLAGPEEEGGWNLEGNPL